MSTVDKLIDLVREKDQEIRRLTNLLLSNCTTVVKSTVDIDKDPANFTPIGKAVSWGNVRTKLEDLHKKEKSPVEDYWEREAEKAAAEIREGIKDNES